MKLDIQSNVFDSIRQYLIKTICPVKYILGG